MDLSVLILAAGKGTRMKSNHAKVLHTLAGRPMVQYVCDAAEPLHPRHMYLVIGHQGEQVQKALDGPSVRWLWQRDQKGTGHAVLCFQEAHPGASGDLLLLYGDTPLIRTETLRRLVDHHRATGAHATLLTARVENPLGYGRILRDGSGRIQAIVEERDASTDQKQIREINTGIYCFQTAPLFDAIRRISSNNSQGEYYLTDVIGLEAAAGLRIESMATEDRYEYAGINSRMDLVMLEKELRSRKLDALMKEGITIRDPDSTFVDDTVRIGRDTEIFPGVVITGQTAIGEGCRIYPGVRISDSVLGNEVKVLDSSIIVASRVGNGTTVGPFAHVREHSEIGENARIGNFVEVKKSRLGNGTKAAHLAYLGDAIIGDRVNIGAGTITCNYDGYQKNQTIIEDEVFIGSDSQLVAPVRIGRGAYVAAGSTVTEDVPPNALAIARGRQVIKQDWVEKRKKAKPYGKGTEGR
ncbi:MAG: bifunctional UDP-N-acetylglucosamine diphosphorylase/glucosamine-1-phosphate N-acetyltransferase GlmU [Acidobacteria bacterium]|nr:bifunctional UDP-N-acetylglucosamine diphosphorylase/glucosamine-1-phosphate N-acetyltransferase GlmU [Acidobacteriota bacterium]